MSIYLRDPALETLPYVEGYGGEFCDGILQKAGPRWVPGMSLFLYIVTAFDHLSQTVPGIFMIMIVLDATDVMLLIVRQHFTGQ